MRLPHFWDYFKMTKHVHAPCAPMTNACSISAVLEGPEMKVPKG